MKLDPTINRYLNAALKESLTAINQYFLHARMIGNWGLERLEHLEYEASIRSMKQSDTLIERILFLDGTPNMQRLFPVRVGEDPIEQHELDLQLELEALERLKRGIELCWKKADHGTRELLEKILSDEEEAVDWLETQLALVQTLGKQNYLAQQLEE